MKKEDLLKSILLISTALILITPWNAVAAEKKPKKAGDEQLLTRIDFGNSYIKGQTLKSGSVYMLQRKKSEMKTMLKYRETYRKEILEENGLTATEPKTANK